MDNISVEVLRHPLQSDWERCKMLALNTIGKRYAGSAVTDSWKRGMLMAGHSPIRTLMFTIRLEIPYYVSTHLVRHKFGVEHFVSSQRNDRQDAYDRRKAPQDAMVTHIIDVNAQELAQMAQMRLCGQADPATQAVMRRVVNAVLATNPEFSEVLLPKCLVWGRCNELRPCGLVDGTRK